MTPDSPAVVRSVVALIRDDDGRVLLASGSDDGPWSCIGGAVGEQEPVDVAAGRHALADCGLVIETGATVAELSGDQYRVLYECGADTTYAATVLDATIVSETTANAALLTRWHTPDEAASIYLDEFATTALADLGIIA